MSNPSMFERCAGELEDYYRVVYGTSSNHAPVTEGSGSVTGGTIVRIDQGGGKKPHYAIVDGTGRKVFETTGFPSGMRRRLEKLEGREVISYTWSPFIVAGRRAEYGPQTIGELRIKPQDRPAPDGPAIKAIYFDTETTGLNPERDEILQLSIVDQDGNTLWDRKYRPVRVKSWDDAEDVHHISPEDVADRPPIEDEISEIQDIFDRAEKVYAWNNIFDLAFLGRAGLKLDRGKAIDSMEEYGRLEHGRRQYKLEEAAAECGYTYNAHDSLEDSLALKVVQDYVDDRRAGRVKRRRTSARKRQRCVEPTPVIEEKPVEVTPVAAVPESETIAATVEKPHPVEEKPEPVPVVEVAASAPSPSSMASAAAPTVPESPAPAPVAAPQQPWENPAPSRKMRDQRKSVLHGVCVALEIVSTLVTVLFVSVILSSLGDTDTVIGGIICTIPLVIVLALCEWGRRRNRQ